MEHKDMDAWKQSMFLVEEVYRLTGLFPREEVYGLVSQMRRAAVSIPSNLSEGAARESAKEFGYFVNVAIGSVSELETQLIIANRLGYTEIDTILQRLSRVKSLVLGLRNYLKRQQVRTNQKR